jgi:hypothetical protein
MSFAQLVHVAQRGNAGRAPLPPGRQPMVNFRAPSKPARPAQPHGARTRAVLQLLRERGAQSTPQVAQALGMTTHAVGSLLKHCKQRGQVLRADGKWLINPEHQPTAVTRAAALLRRLGWTVTPPAAA